ncbi:unnamed protein product [Microthlaspi erraticum]|uniref:F-box domain-containing protein n=1 Tax=Microthlaspi erraticum TaxID=1685480 RepID=A0A6D2L1R2_9BRAS|nr:unnamed protein product [Microthlaspi erraticum]
MEKKTPKSGGYGWSKLPHDLLRPIFESLGFPDFRRARIVCWNWHSVSKLTLPRKTESPWLMLIPEGDNGCVLYNPEEDKVYTTMRDFSGVRFLANSGNWSLVLDSRSNLYIIDLFSEEKIDLPPLESIKPCKCTLKRVGDKDFERRVYDVRHTSVSILRTDVMRGRLWVDEKTKEYVVLWFFNEPANCVCFCKNGDDRYTNIPLRFNIFNRKQAIYDVVLVRGHDLYIQSNRDYIRHLRLCGPQGFEDVSWSNPVSRRTPCQLHANCDITVVTSSGEVMLVQSILDKTSTERGRSFRVFKKNPKPNPNQYYVEVDSLGDESLFLGLRTTVPGIQPNSIYFTSYDSVCWRLLEDLNMDICVFNLATKTFKSFPRISNMKLKAARWFLPDSCGT